MTTIADLVKEIEALKERNKRVDANKAWETSLMRKIILMGITYIVVSLTLWTIHNPAPLINAIIPAIGFFLSTLTLSFIKKYWQDHQCKISHSIN
jgi:hypothetical protein